MARTNEPAATSCMQHELREVLISHHLPGILGGSAHLMAMQFETIKDIVVSDGYYKRKKVRV